MKICPHCGGKARQSHAHGFLGRKILHRIGLRAFHCCDCNSHFYRFPSNGAHPENGKQTAFTAPGSDPEVKKAEFQKLVANIRDAETKAELKKISPPPNGLSDLESFNERQESLFPGRPGTVRKPARVDQLERSIVEVPGQ